MACVLSVIVLFPLSLGVIGRLCSVIVAMHGHLYYSCSHAIINTSLTVLLLQQYLGTYLRVKKVSTETVAFAIA